ncbi:MAG: D-aminoacyl-tRNA deacylase [Acidilobaceae archaeon]|nr:D-aminoacyl-tRNA deacylase [Acidilobaceae archaeon]
MAFSVGDVAGRGAAAILSKYLKAREVSCPGAVECYASELTVIAGYVQDVVELEVLDELPAAEAFVVLSRHKAESGRRTLSVHHPGNPTEAQHGGKPRKLAVSYPALARELLLNYRETSRGLEGYELTLEATHHGPTEVRRPVVFIEIGSTEEEWRDERAQASMALAVLKTLSGGIRGCRAAVGIGGTHYPARFTKMQLEEDICFGHILAKYQLPSVSEDVLRQAFLRTYPEPAKIAVVEKKSVKREQRELIERVAAEQGAEVEYV